MGMSLFRSTMFRGPMFRGPMFRGIILVAVAVAVLCAGCAKRPAGFASAPLRAEAEDIRIQPGDVVEFKFFETPELNDSQAVRPGGRVTLQMVGDVRIFDMTPREAALAIQDAYKDILRTPRVVVIVRSQPERRVYVGGEVRSPGPVPMGGSLTALEAVMAAGGFDPLTSEPSRVIVIRHEGGQRYGAGVDLSLPLDGEATEPFYLKPKDIVFVPKSFIADVNQWIDQHINKIVPEVGYSFGRSSTHNGKTTSHTLDLKRN